jgi:CxxC motif-containing protein (DUF1111 family)
MSLRLTSLAEKSWNVVCRHKATLGTTALLVFSCTSVVVGQFVATDPGPRSDLVGAGRPLASVASSPSVSQFFQNGLSRFQETEVVTSSNPNANIGLGPRYNSNQCSSCHAQPSVGGSSPSTTAYPYIGPNPQTQVANLDGQTNQNTIPSFITADGPVREVRFPFFLNPGGTSVNTSAPDGGVHDLYVISGRKDAGSCSITQPDFATNVGLGNAIFRIPTPTYGDGLIENIPDETILANAAAAAAAAEAMNLNVGGHANRNGNDGTITRFGWKAQNKSLEIFAGEAYNVEMGVTNELFQDERASPDEALAGGLPANCLLNPTPEDATNFTVSPTRRFGGGLGGGNLAQVPSDVVQFAMFMRLLAPPTPSTSNPGGAASIARGQALFASTGCALCHTPTMKTGQSSLTAGLSQVNANLFSDLLVHHMGTNLADNVSQGNAGPDEFRTAPLWGLGQRVYFLHDGRTSNLIDAIQQHASSGSDANGVITNYGNLSPQQQQDLLNFLRSL